MVTSTALVCTDVVCTVNLLQPGITRISTRQETKQKSGIMPEIGHLYTQTARRLERSPCNHQTAINSEPGRIRCSHDFEFIEDQAEKRRLVKAEAEGGTQHKGHPETGPQ